MSYEFFREVNTVVPLVAFGWLGYRIRHAWPADWAKPHYVWHYRALLLIVSTGVLLTSVGAIVHELKHSEATFISMLYTLQSLAVLGLCYAWPPLRRRRWRVAAQAAHTAAELSTHPPA
jgi:hypothetical protein